MNRYICIVILLLTITSCQSQTKKIDKNQIVGGYCEGCEAIFEYGNKKLYATDTLPKFQESTPKLKITGTVYMNDGKTPAENVILYIYHTNENGIYETKGNEQGWAKRHGYIRGWVKTEKNGKYGFYTFKPAPYPNGRAANHIHIIVVEPHKNEYYIDDFMFETDSLLTKQEKNRLSQRGGSGIIALEKQNELLLMKRDIILGLNIPHYD